MLTKKEHLLFKKSKGHIIPKFIDTNDCELQDYSQALIEVLKTSLGKTRKEIEGELQNIHLAFEGEENLKKGMEHLIFRKMEFDSDIGDEIYEFRNSIFAEAKKIFLESDFESIQSFQNKVSLSSNMSLNAMQKQIYCDLPQDHKVQNFKNMSIKALLHLYNLSLVQGLLMHCENLEITIPNYGQSILELRHLLKQMRFYQLVAKIESFENKYIFKIDGPLSLFYQTQKYGLQLACFFPCVVLLPEWQISADIQFGNKTRGIGQLVLDNTDGLVSHYKSFNSYVPEEVQLFINNFNSKTADWQVQGYLGEILFDGEQYFFPDLEFKNGSSVCLLEVFHSWHKSVLAKRINALEKGKTIPLLFAVSKDLLKDKDIEGIIINSSLFNERGILFSKIPTVKQVLDLIKKRF